MIGRHREVSEPDSAVRKAGIPPRLPTLPSFAMLIRQTARPARSTSAFMHPGPRSGSIEVIAGVMFSGKSEELIRRVRRALIARRRVQVFKSHLDERYAGLQRVSSHDGRSFEAIPISSAIEVMSLVEPETELHADGSQE